MTETAYALDEHVTVTPTPGGAVLLNRRTGTYWQLNATAALVLDCLRHDGTPEQAATALAERHPAAAGRARSDVDAILHTFQEAGVLTPRPRG